jgi:hypothetical protein
LPATIYHAVGTYDGTNFNLYLNGSLVAGPFAASPIVGGSNGTLRVGSDWTSQYFNGLISNAAIYATALSPTRIAAHYSAGSTGPQPYRSIILSDTPIAFWPFNELASAGATFHDVSGNSHSWTSNLPTTHVQNLLSSGADPLGSSALGGSAGSSPVAIPLTDAAFGSTNFASHFTLEAWCFPSSLPNGSMLISQSASINGYVLGFSAASGPASGNGAYPYVGYYDGSAWHAAVAPSPVPNVTTTYLAGTWDGATLTIYVNGSPVATASASGPTNINTTTIQAGLNGSGGGSPAVFQGLVQNMAVYNTALSAARILAHYNGGIAVAVTTTTSLAVAVNPVIQGVSDLLTATISGGASPTGTVTFYDGAASIGTAVVASATASISVPFSTIGAHSLTAAYSGDAFNLASTSTPVTLTVNGPTANPTTTTLTLSANPIVQGLTEALTATVVGTSPTGLVQFFSNGTLIGTVTLSAGVATLNYPFNTTGLYNLQATYIGNIVNLSSSSNAILSVVTPNPAIHGDVTPYLNLITSEYQNVS